MDVIPPPLPGENPNTLRMSHGRKIYEFVLGSWRILLSIVISMAAWGFNQLSDAIKENTHEFVELRVSLSNQITSMNGRIDSQASQLTAHDAHFLRTDEAIVNLRERYWSLRPAGSPPPASPP